jgi:hypothetical protein
MRSLGPVVILNVFRDLGFGGGVILFCHVLCPLRYADPIMLPIILIVTHWHLNDHAFEKTLSGVMARAKAVGVQSFIVPAYDLLSLGRTVEPASSFPGAILPNLGIHPW